MSFDSLDEFENILQNFENENSAPRHRSFKKFEDFKIDRCDYTSSKTIYTIKNSGNLADSDEDYLTLSDLKQELDSLKKLDQMNQIIDTLKQNSKMGKMPNGIRKNGTYKSSVKSTKSNLSTDSQNSKTTSKLYRLVFKNAKNRMLSLQKCQHHDTAGIPASHCLEAICYETKSLSRNGTDICASDFSPFSFGKSFDSTQEDLEAAEKDIQNAPFSYLAESNFPVKVNRKISAGDSFVYLNTVSGGICLPGNDPHHRHKDYGCRNTGG